VATIKNLTIDQGSRYQLNITVQGIPNLTGFQARGMIRKHKADAIVLADITASLSVDVPNSFVVVDIAAATTAGYNWSTGVYDIEVYSGATVYRVLQGNVNIDEEVTRT